MTNNRLSFRTAGRNSRGGFTLVELLVVIGIIAILAGVALGPITSGIEKAKENAAMQTARQINLLLFSYASDNNQTYPVGTGTSAADKSEGIAINLLQGKYTNDPTIFAISSAAKYTGTSADFSDFAAANIQWDFTEQGAGNGITSTSSDLLPVVFCTGETVSYPSSGGLNLTLSGTGPFRNNGIAVGYKGNNAVFIKGILSGSTAKANGFISTSFNDNPTPAYNQVKP